MSKEREKKRKAHRNYVLLRDFTVDGTIDEKCSDYKGLRDSHKSRSSFHSWQRFSFTRERKRVKSKNCTFEGNVTIFYVLEAIFEASREDKHHEGRKTRS